MKYLILLCLILSSQLSWSQNDLKEVAEMAPETEVRAVIDSLFLGMRIGDSSIVANVFHADNRMMSSYISDSGQKSNLHTGTLDEFIIAVGTPHDEVWDERISNVVIQVDDNLAQAWMNYSFYLDDTFSHCGVNAFQLVKTENGWKIMNLLDTRRKESCDK